MWTCRTTWSHLGPCGTFYWIGALALIHRVFWILCASASKCGYKSWRPGRPTSASATSSVRQHPYNQIGEGKRENLLYVVWLKGRWRQRRLKKVGSWRQCPIKKAPLVPYSKHATPHMCNNATTWDGTRIIYLSINDKNSDPDDSEEGDLTLELFEDESNDEIQQKPQQLHLLQISSSIGDVIQKYSG